MITLVSALLLFLLEKKRRKRAHANRRERQGGGGEKERFRVGGKGSAVNPWLEGYTRRK